VPKSLKTQRKNKGGLWLNIHTKILGMRFFYQKGANQGENVDLPV